MSGSIHLLASTLDEKVEENEALVDVSPVLSVVVQTLPDDGHDLGEGGRVVRHVCDLAHESRRWAPRVVAAIKRDLDLEIDRYFCE